MSNQQILTKAIEKAIAGGWHEGHDFTVVGGHIYDLDNLRTDDLIYWHSFAKALWGEEPYAKHYYMFENGTHWRERDDRLPNWSWQLQQIVIADDPIKYLGENI